MCGANRSYLIATGPSARTALSLDLCDGVRIVCNTAVLDDELMSHVAPNIVTFADPIFHFGPSTYAHEFQLALVAQAQRHDFTIVTVERFAGLLRSRLPESPSASSVCAWGRGVGPEPRPHARVSPFGLIRTC